jgi:predicted metalloprotease with PDZ domain
MRALWERHGKTGVGVPEDGVERVAEEVSGVDLRAFFDRALRSTEDLPLAELLAAFGIDLTLRAAESEQDKGGKPSATPRPARSTLGVRLADSVPDATLGTVFEGGAAHAAGLAAGDVIIAVDGLRATRGNVETLVGSSPPGTTVRIQTFRRDELREVAVTLKVAPMDTCFLTIQDRIDEATRSRRSAWLDGVNQAT